MKKIITLIVLLLSLQSIFSQTNISLNKISIASAGISSTGAFDGDLTTAWNAVGYAPAWISVDLGSISSVNHIVFNVSQAPAGNTEHEVYSSIDGINWQIVETINLYTENNMEFTRNYNNLNGIRYLKIQTISSPSWVAWYEISVFGTQEPTPPTVGLVAHYKFNGNTNDESGNNNNGLSSGGLTYTTDAFGNCNSACQFNGSDNFINIPNSATLQSPNQEITISTWIKANDINNNGAYFLCKNSLGNLDPFQYRMGLNHTAIFLGFKNSPTETIDLQVNTTISSNEWKFVASTYNGSIAKFYIDGVLVGTADYVGQIFQDDKSLDIGRDAHGPIEWFNGALDNLRIYKTALNQQQVTDLYNAEKPSNAGTNYQAGITVLVHGFQMAGGGVGNYLSPIEDFEKMGADIINRAGGGIMYTNNPDTGQLIPVSNTVFPYTLDANKEIVLIYNWGDLSNNGVISQIFEGNGYLEASADNLFATILKLANPNNTPMSYSLQQFLNKPKHLIGHSRGTILLLQTLHRFANYFSNTNFEQVTFLDGHPATPFGDMVSTYNNSPLNLPGVLGSCTNCYSNSFTNTGCDNTTANLMMPINVLKADTYHRQDGQFEGLTSAASYGSFDGLPIPLLGLFDRELDNATLSNLTYAGGAHSNVHKWYRATIDTNIDVTDSEIGGTNLWFGNGIGSPMGANNFMFNECRSSTGFAYSRIGGRYNELPLISPNYKLSLTQLNQALAEREGVSATNPNGIAPHNVFNGDFHYNNNAGWIKNGGSEENLVSILNEKAIINTSMSSGVTYLGESYLKHSLMYFGGNSENNNYLQFDIKKHNFTNTGQCIIKFYNTAGQEIETSSIDLSYVDDTWKTVFIPIPDNLKPTSTTAFNGEVGTFGIFGSGITSSSFEVDNIKLNSCIPISSNLLITMPDPTTLNFADVQNDDWFKEGVYKSRNYGLFRGTSATTFSPETNLSKAQAVTVLVREAIKLGSISAYNTTGTPYSDVSECNQYFPYIQTAKNLGYLDAGTTFNPEANITVAELCVYMDKILQINQHDWNNATPWVIAPTSAYIFNQMSQIVISQTDPIKQNAMRRILNCIDVVKNDNIIDSYRTQNVWTLHNVENNTLSNGQPINVDDSATVTRSRMAVAAANMYRFIYKKLNSGVAPLGRTANTTNTTINDPSIDDFIGIGNTFDNKDVPATETPEAPTQITFNINSGETLNLQYQSDTDTAGNPQFFYWSMNKNVDSNLANLVSVPINSIPNHRKVSFVAPVLTAPRTWYLYSYLANNKGKIKETVITINVSPSLGIDVLNGTIDLVKVYPNPVNDILNIEATNAEIQKIELYDLLGKLILAEKVKTDKYKLNIAHLQNATYQLKLYTDKGIQSLKVVKN